MTTSLLSPLPTCSVHPTSSSDPAVSPGPPPLEPQLLDSGTQRRRWNLKRTKGSLASTGSRPLPPAWTPSPCTVYLSPLPSAPPWTLTPDTPRLPWSLGWLTPSVEWSVVCFCFPQSTLRVSVCKLPTKATQKENTHKEKANNEGFNLERNSGCCQNCRQAVPSYDLVENGLHRQGTCVDFLAVPSCCPHGVTGGGNTLPSHALLLWGCLREAPCSRGVAALHQC